MDPPSLLVTIGSAFISKLEHQTLFALAFIVVIWWVYKEAFWKKVVRK